MCDNLQSAVSKPTVPSVSTYFCSKLHLLLGKSTKTGATRAALFDFNLQQIVCRLGFCPRLHWVAYSAPQTPLLDLGDLVLRRGRRDGVSPLPYEEKRKLGAYDKHKIINY